LGYKVVYVKKAAPKNLMTKRKNHIAFFFFALFLCLFLAKPVLALEINYPSVPGATPPQDFINTAKPEDILVLYAQYFLNLTIWLSGLIALAVLVAAGISYLISAGKPERIISAKQYIISVFFGILILLSSYLILNTINPQILSFTTEPLSSPEISPRPSLPPAPESTLKTTIDFEMPFARIIEGNMFEFYYSKVPALAGVQVFNSQTQTTPAPIPAPQSSEPVPRMQRITDIANSIYVLAQQLKDQSQQLKYATDQCSCDNPPNSEPKPCCSLSQPGPGCANNQCRSKERCTSDACINSRQKIQELETKNLEVIYLGAQITIPDAKNNSTKQVRTSLNEEIKKALTEIEDLKIETKRLERAKKFIKECPFRNTNSLARFFIEKQFLLNDKWTSRETPFWDDVSTVFKKMLTNPSVSGSATKYLRDYGTIMCVLGGTIEGFYPFATTSSDQTSPELDRLEQELEKTRENEDPGITVDTTQQGKTMACHSEAPVGEIIDRSIRTGYKLAERMDGLVSLSKDMIKEVVGSIVPQNSQQQHQAIEGNSVNTDGLQVWVSQCSSQRCYSQCICYGCGEGDSPYCTGYTGDGCTSNCCPCQRRCTNSPQYPEGPCPKTEINASLQKIIDIFEGVPRGLNNTDNAKQKEGIQDVVKGLIPQTTQQKTKFDLTPERREQVGILPLIEQLVPNILAELEINVRRPMQQCSPVSWEKEDIALFGCLQARSATIPGGRVIHNCCRAENWVNGEQQQTLFGNCLDACYLEIGQNNYRNCVKTCLNFVSQQIGEKEIADCIHEINFYCCSVK